MRQLLYFIPTFLLFFACNEAPKNSEASTAHTGRVLLQSFKGSEAFLSYQEKVDQTQDIQQQSSLLYTHVNGDLVQAYAYFDRSEELLKGSISTTTTDGQKLTHTFYFLKEELCMAIVEQESTNCGKLQVTTEMAFFNTKQDLIATYQETKKNTYRAHSQSALSATIKPTLQQFYQVFNQEADFELRFIGFDEAYNHQFIQLGNSNYTTQLAYAPKETLIEAMKKAPAAWKGIPLKVQFQDVSEANGFSYQVLTELKKR
jgi:hypothetical protein